MTLSLINNIAFLIALVAAGLIIVAALRNKPAPRKIMLGILFGGVTLLGMANPVAFVPGVIFDGRSIVLAVAGVVGGPLTAAIAAAPAALYRLQIGGAGTAVGISVVVLAASMGVLAHHLWQRRSRPPAAREYLVLGLAVQLMQLAAFTQIPDGAGLPFIRQAWWVLLLCYAPATMLLCMMFRNYEQQLADRSALRRAQDERIAQERAHLQRFHAYFNQSIVGLAITGTGKGWIEVNDALCATLGYSRAELMQLTWAALTHPQDLGADEVQFERMLAGEIDGYAMDKRFLHKDGHVVYTRLAVSHVRTDDGKVDYMLAMVEDISERKLAEMALHREQQFSLDILNALPGVFYMFDVDNRLVRWNHQLGRITGYTDTELAGKLGTEFFSEADRAEVTAAMRRTTVDGQADLDADLLTRDGESLPYHFTGTRSFIGDQTYMLGVGIDISKQRRAQEILETERAQLHTLVNTIPDLVWLKDGDGRYLACNPEFERFFGATASAIVGRTDYDFVPRDLADSFREHDRAVMEAGEPIRKEELVTYASDGRRVLLETTKVPMRTPDGRVVGVLGISHDISERKAHQQQLERIAHYDVLTGLPNRVLLADRMKQAFARTQRSGRMMAVAYFDLDGFKAVNDRFGHDAGDRLLRALSEHLSHALRETDTLARLGGDEFVAILLDLPDVESSAPLVSRLLAAASEVCVDEGSLLRLSASMGVTFYPQSEPIDADQLLRQADHAMYQAKLAGKNRYVVFDAEQDRKVRERHESVLRIRRALQSREFVLHYQPKVNMRTGAIVGLEVLVRWQHPERGLLLPGAFMPLIADHTLAVELGEWVLDAAMTQLEAWKATGRALPVSVNIDAVQLEQTTFVDRLSALIAAHPGIGPGDLELEVLETSALLDIAQATRVILACRRMGVGFALDDFGTGYSSLTYLKRLPANVLKIDQSFVRDMMDDPDDLAILEGVLGLSKAFQRQVIAEGVETLAQGEMLLCLGCELAQGYAIARPMPAADIPAWLDSWRPDPSWLGRAPFTRDDLADLIGLVECRALVRRVAAYVQDTGPLPDEEELVRRDAGDASDATACARLRARAGAQAMTRLLDQISQGTAELIRLKQAGRTEDAVSRLPELYSARDRLLEEFLGAFRAKS